MNNLAWVTSTRSLTELLGVVYDFDVELYQVGSGKLHPELRCAKKRSNTPTTVTRRLTSLRDKDLCTQCGDIACDNRDWVYAKHPHGTALHMLVRLLDSELPDKLSVRAYIAAVERAETLRTLAVAYADAADPVDRRLGEIAAVEAARLTPTPDLEHQLLVIASMLDGDMLRDDLAFSYGIRSIGMSRFQDGLLNSTGPVDAVVADSFRAETIGDLKRELQEGQWSRLFSVEELLGYVTDISEPLADQMRAAVDDMAADLVTRDAATLVATCRREARRVLDSDLAVGVADVSVHHSTEARRPIVSTCTVFADLLELHPVAGRYVAVGPHDLVELMFRQAENKAANWTTVSYQVAPLTGDRDSVVSTLVGLAGTCDFDDWLAVGLDLEAVTTSR